MTDSSAWDTYWRGADSSAAFTGGGSNHPAVVGFWRDYFAGRRGDDGSVRLIDIAGGNGAVIETARAVLEGGQIELTCLDTSAAAIHMVSTRFPGVRGVVADAADIPLDTASFNVVTSQFGIEYAGLHAVDEAVRLLAPGGQLAFLLHHAGGAIHRQCAASRDAVTRLLEARFLLCSVEVFETGYALARGGDAAAYEAAAERFAPALRAVEDIMADCGRDVADGTVMRLYNDVRTLYDGMQNYEPADVLEWCRRMEAEIVAYRDRMAAMCSVAVDEAAFRDLCAKLQAQALRLVRADALLDDKREATLAWALIAQRP